jgi:glucoamylase
VTPSAAPGWPGIPARWTSSAKSGVGTSLSPASRVWFTIGYGILNEVYYPRIDQACTRDLGLLVTDGEGLFSEEKRDTLHTVALPEPGVPCYHLSNACPDGRFRIDKWVLTDPQRDVVLQRIRFAARSQAGEPTYRVFALLAPHLGNQGAGNTTWIDAYKGVPMLFAERGGVALALASSTPWLARSVGFVGSSDGWQDLVHHRQLTWRYERAENGNVAMIGELDFGATDELTLALGFGSTWSEAGNRALASLQDGFDAIRDAYIAECRAWQDTLASLDRWSPTPGRYRTSAMVLRAHEAKRFQGGLIASLSIPWGSAKGDNDLGGYHLVWPRDLVEAAGGLLAAGAHDDVRRILTYLQSIQEPDGHWVQNSWMDGTPYWSGVQMDETALPILLVDLAYREGALNESRMERFWPMVRAAAAFLVQNGPVTGQDRWEEDPGYSPFTLAVEIAALLAAADVADRSGDATAARYLRETADIWNSAVESWTYVTDTDLARAWGVEGYYVRIAPPDTADAASPASGFVPIKNRPPGASLELAASLVSPDALALVRFGLRAADDPRIRNTLVVIDTVLEAKTPAGPSWHRYQDDGYGEHEDGSAFDGTGIGRAWPLLTGERAHYELAAGNTSRAEELLRALEAFASDGGMIPEQVWDAPDIPEKALFAGRPTGSAMPLVWAHAEHVKLLRSLRDGRVFDRPPQPFERYATAQTGSPHAAWRFNCKRRRMAAGKILRIEVLAAATVRWSADGWATRADVPTVATGLGVHIADLETRKVPEGSRIRFAFHWSEAGGWEGTDFVVAVT